MAYKLLIAICFFGIAHGAVSRIGAPLAPVLAKAVEVEEYDPHPQYKYGYDVQDSISGDAKGHIEERDGDVVRGEYSLVDADGLKRTVTYTADPINGFNAVVRREPLVVAAPVVKAAPLAVAPVVRTAQVVAQPAAVVKSAPIVAPASVLRTAPLAASPFVYSGQVLAYRNL